MGSFDFGEPTSKRKNDERRKSNADVASGFGQSRSGTCGQGTGLTGITAATKTLDRYLRPDLLIIDDMGMKQLPKRSGEYLFEIIMRRYQVRSTLMTSNRPLEDWGKLIGDVPSATAILDRFLHNAEVITITGRSYRLRDRSGKTANANDPGEKTKADPACESVGK